MDDKATALPLPPRLQHFLCYSFKEVLIALKMVFLVMTALKNVAKQDYHLLKTKVSQPAFAAQLLLPSLLCLSQQVVRLSQ